MDGIDEFHKHLDECKQCRENPFGLCWVGQRLLLRATVMPVMGGLTQRARDAKPASRKIKKSKKVLRP